jgi:uncharacterized Tic20 family protein
VPFAGKEAPVNTALAVPKEHRKYAVACHVSAAAGFIVPWFGVGLGPLVAWLVVRHEHPSLDAHGREAIQFNASMMAWMALGSGIAWLLGSLAWFLTLALAGLWVACFVFAAVKASEGGSYRYPLTVRFLER